MTSRTIRLSALFVAMLALAACAAHQASTAVQPQAPHYDGTGHCNDNGNDSLCTYASAIPYDSSQGFYIDYKDDDYVDPGADPGSGSTAKLPWWTINLSRFLCPPSSLDPSGSDCSLPNNPVY